MTDQLHIMMDMETLSLKPNPVIISIGAVSFDPLGNDILAEHHVHVSARSGAEVGLDIQGDTIRWWLQQPQELVNTHIVASFSGGETVGIKEALHGLNGWIHDLQNQKRFKQKTHVYLWGNGVAQDNVWLKEAFAACGIDCPWHKYYHDRDLRTVIALAEQKSRGAGAFLEQLPFEGEKHNALHDARHQMRTCQRAHKILLE